MNYCECCKKEFFPLHYKQIHCSGACQNGKPELEPVIKTPTMFTGEYPSSFKSALVENVFHTMVQLGKKPNQESIEEIQGFMIAHGLELTREARFQFITNGVYLRDWMNGC